MSKTTRTQGHALQVGVQRKLASSNWTNCRSMGLTCIPLVAETLGGLADDFISTIRDISRSIGLRSGADGDKITTKHLFGRVRIALWRGNTSMLIHRSPTPDTLRISFLTRLYFTHSFVLYPLVCTLLALNFPSHKKRRA